MNHRIALIFSLIFLLGIELSAQEKFADLSAKERIDIAEQEAIEAAQDAVFQEMMQKGHALFKEEHYLKAIHAYEKAQDRRPYNVYPKVIIADIELSMKDTLKTLRAAEQRELQKDKPILENKSEEVKKDKSDTDTPEETREERMQKLNQWEAQERRERERRREAQNENQEPAKIQIEGDIKQLSAEDYQKSLAQKYPDGITEKVTSKGNKVIVERIVVADGEGNKYKKVTHSWGGIFYFKNGDAVTERVWKSETE